LDGSYNCPQHGNVNPDFSYVLNVFLDDGTGNLRAVFFRNQVEKLLEKSREELLSYRTNAQEFEKVKHDMLGKMIKIMGRATKNVMFDRLEFTAQLVFPNPDPVVEIKRLKGEDAGEELSIGQMNELNKDKPVEKPAVEEVKTEKPVVEEVKPVVETVEEKTEPVIEEKPVGEELVQEIAKTIAGPVVESQTTAESTDVKEIEKELESETIEEKPVQDTVEEKPEPPVVEEIAPAPQVEEEAVSLDDLPPVEEDVKDPAEEDKAPL